MMWETITVDRVNIVCNHLNRVVVSDSLGSPGDFVDILHPDSDCLRCFDIDSQGNHVATSYAAYRIVSTGTEIVVGGFRFSDGYTLLEHAPRRITT